MNVTQTFQLGLALTGMGMGLVFLTLIIIMGCIWLLDHAFKPKVEDKEAASDATIGAAVTSGALPTSASASSLSDEAAAIAVAIALQQQQSAKAQAPYVSTPYEEEILGEVVTVAALDAGHSVWKSYGRLKALS
jgi:sodium pump decarboxylase gamma subunit